jgi:hypothetical protein
MRATRRLILTVVALALLLAPIADARTIRRSVPAAGLSFALPSTWRAVDARAATSAAVRTIGKENPELATVLQQLGRPDSVVKFFAFDPARSASFATNVNIVVSPVPAGATLEHYLVAARIELQALPTRVGEPALWVERLPAGQAVRTRVKIAIRRSGKQIVSDITQWAFLRPGRSIVVSFTTTTNRRPHYVPIFTAAARSIRFS